MTQDIELILLDISNLAKNLDLFGLPDLEQLYNNSINKNLISD
jgi:hypothetical protein